MAERDHYLAERDHCFRQMKIHQKEVGRLQQENTELRNRCSRTQNHSLHVARPHRYPTRRNKPKLMDPPNTDILELKEKMSKLINVMQGFALGQKAIAEKVERIESWLRVGKIQGNAPSSGVKKPCGNGQRKKEGESSDVYAQRGHGRDRYHPYAAAVTIPAGNQSVQQQQQPPQQRTQRVGYHVRGRMADRQFDRPPVTYAFLFKRLKDLGLVQLRTLAPVGPDQRPASNDENVKCEFHSGAPGHNIEGCKAFKHVVQDLVDSKAINFAPTQNVNANPMSMHGHMGVNVISEDKRKIEVTDVDQLRTQMYVVKRHLMKSGVFPGCNNCCAACTVTTNGCVMLRETIQRMMDEGSPRFEKVALEKEDVSIITIYFDPVHFSVPTDAAPVTITVPGPIPYENDDAVSWDYGGEVYCNGEKIEDQAASDTTVSKVDNAGLSGFTRSGRLFAPDTLRSGDAEKEKRDKAEALARAKGKKVVNEGIPRAAQAPVGSENELDDEAEEFLRIIKKSEYKLVDHLQQTPSKISILSLLLSSEGHRDALLKILKRSYVPQEITVNQFETVVLNVNASHGLGFTDLDLTVDGCNHNKALHILMECKGEVLSHVLVDTGSSLNVLPKKAMAKLDCEGVVVRPTDLVVRAFDGSKRAVFGEVELPVKIGPEVFKFMFYVMDIQPAYSCLLGRPWIHAAGAVTSTLHQKLKYIWDGQVVTVYGEEDIFVSHLSSFKYVEMDSEIFETPCQAFETVKVENAIFAWKEKKSSIASYKQVAEVVRSGEAPGWGRMIDITVKGDRFGVGYQSGQGSSGQNRGRRQPFMFTSAKMLDPDRVCVVGEETDSDCELDSWIKPCVPGMKI
ncbi:hypothetical protein KIW84_074773 [Lathyrus oleraceus]|uniref:Uncharacterized protein n=1 Tax=Pisum sativum TaxID=3888 RepID=A0A9D5A0Z3_PEA|nr:hypothetical protein KIW84_074773 [Pisum sativum]